MGKSRESAQNNGCQREWKPARGKKNGSMGDVQKPENGNVCKTLSTHSIQLNRALQIDPLMTEGPSSC